MNPAENIWLRLTFFDGCIIYGGGFIKTYGGFIFFNAGFIFRSGELNILDESAMTITWIRQKNKWIRQIIDEYALDFMRDSYLYVADSLRHMADSFFYLADLFFFVADSSF
jgi:hypothetical protein